MGFETAMADAAAFFVTCMGLVPDHAANLWHDVDDVDDDAFGYCMLSADLCMYVESDRGTSSINCGIWNVYDRCHMMITERFLPFLLRDTGITILATVSNSITKHEFPNATTHCGLQHVQMAPSANEDRLQGHREFHMQQ